MAIKGDVSDLDTLTFGGKPIVPRTGYSMNKRSGVVSNDVPGGATRQRRKYYGNVIVADATITCDNASLVDFLLLFIERNTGKYFVCHTMADRALVEPCVVQIIGEPDFSDLTAVGGEVGLTLEIVSVRDKETDDELYTIYTTLGDAEGLFLSLEKLVREYPL